MRTIHSLPRKVAGLVPLLLVAALGACTETEYVEVERPPFNPPADAASGFLGYYTVSTQQTTCGNCHADFQGSWKNTGHAKAYATLKANSGAQPFCYSCHTITARGNSLTGAVGWDKVQDSTYQDVQCESCHGAGQEHVEAVNSGQLTRPLAKIAILPDTGSSCGACHNGTHHPFVEQWSASRHALVRGSSPNGNASCQQCHESRRRIQIWDPEANYVEKTAANNPYPAPWQGAATCVACHDPHGSSYPANLRRSVSDSDPANNLCMACHLYRVANVPSNSRGNQPHGAQGGVLLGFAGWRPPNFIYDTARIYGSHATTANPRLCAGCHVNQFTVNDPASGNFAFQSVGHLFNPIPCVDATGKPTGSHDCAYTPAARNWSSCTTSGCHATANAAASAFNATKAEIKFLADILWIDSNGNKTVDNFPTDGGYLPRIKANTTDLNPSDATVTAADGAELNVRTCGEALADHPDGSSGAHNKFLCVALLSQSASYLKSIYGFLPSPPANVQAIWDEWSRPITNPAIRVTRENFPIMDR